MGFTTGRSVINNAAIHVKQNYVLNIDLKDFFPSIEQWRVCVKDERLRKAALEKVIECAISTGFEFKSSCVSPIKGGDGNIEYLVHFIVKKE